MDEKPKKRGIELAQEAAKKAGVKVEVVEPKPGAGVIVFLKRKKSEGARDDAAS